MKWHGATDKPCVPTLRHDRNLLLVTVFQAFRDLLSGARSEHNWPNTYVLPSDIFDEAIYIVFIRDYILTAQQLLEPLNIPCGKHFKHTAPRFLRVNSLRLFLNLKGSCSFWCHSLLSSLIIHLINLIIQRLFYFSRISL